MATVTGFKAVTDGYETSWHDWDAVCDGAKPFTGYPIDYTVGGTATPDPAFPGLYVWIDDPSAPIVPVGGGALRRAKSTAFVQEVFHLTGGPGGATAAVPGTRGRVVEVSFDSTDILDPIYPHAPYPSLRADPFTLVVRVSSCAVVSEVDLDA